MEYRYTAIVLKKREVGETDRLYTFYTMEQGKIRAVAKGIRKSGAKLASQLENGMRADVAVARTRGTGKITGALAEESYPNFRVRFGMLRTVLSSLDRFERLIQFDEPDQELYGTLIDFLEYSEKGARAEDEACVRLLSAAFLFRTVARLGYGMEVRVSAVSGQKLTPHGRFFFSPAQGGVVLSSECDQHPAIPISRNAIKLFRVFQEHPFSSVMKIRVSDHDIREIERVVRYLIEWIS